MSDDNNNYDDPAFISNMSHDNYLEYYDEFGNYDDLMSFDENNEERRYVPPINDIKISKQPINNQSKYNSDLIICFSCIIIFVIMYLVGLSL